MLRTDITSLHASDVELSDKEEDKYAMKDKMKETQTQEQALMSLLYEENEIVPTPAPTHTQSKLLPDAFNDKKRKKIKKLTEKERL